jgi:hypothetical protein
MNCVGGYYFGESKRCFGTGASATVELTLLSLALCQRWPAALLPSAGALGGTAKASDTSTSRGKVSFFCNVGGAN